MAEDMTNGMGRARQDLERELFWKVPLPSESIHFVDSPDSEDFSLLLLAFEQSTMIAMDAEWKPIFDKGHGAGHPRVSILQIACRLQGSRLAGKELRKNARHLMEIPCNRAVDKKAGMISSHKAADLASSLERRDHSCDAQNCTGQVIVPARASDSFEGNSENSTTSRHVGDGKKNEGGQATSQLRKSSDLKAADHVSPDIAHARANVQDSTLRRDRSCLTSAEHGAEDEIRDTDLPSHERIGKGDEGAEKEIRCGMSTGEQTLTSEETKACYEMIFLLDLLALPLSAFSEVLKEVFVDPMVLKLGFGFKQDLMHLRGTFPGHSCFDKVEPYLDVGRLYRNLHENKLSYTHRGKRMMLGGDGLAAISETVLGLPLRKDMQCSDWEQRPLTAGQFDYAAADAYSLLAIFDALQVKASESWFSPVVAGDDEGALWSGYQVGVAGVLSMGNGDFGGEGHKNVPSICLPKRRNASVMVEAALGEAGFSGLRENSAYPHSLESHVTRSKTLGIEAIMRRFGEKLLISERQCVVNKRMRRKSRSRQAKETGMTRELQDDKNIHYVGQTPWDDTLGGDGIPKFLCDAMVEGLARQLRCVGIDASSLNSKKCEPRELVNMAEKEGRIILTRDVKLLRSRIVPAGLAYRVKRQGKWDQLAEIIETFKLLINEDQLLSRCTKCNGQFVPKALSAKEVVAQRLQNQNIPDCVLENVDEFWQCATCKHLYWQGSQFTRAYEQFVVICRTQRQ